MVFLACTAYKTGWLSRPQTLVYYIMLLVPDRRRLLPPDHRAQGVRESLHAAEDPLPLLEGEELLDPVAKHYALYLLNRYDDVSDSVYDACMLDGLPYARMVLRAFLFVNTPLHVISAATEVGEDVILAYSRLFFDPTVFRNKLVKMAYLRALVPRSSGEEETKALFLWGLQLGWEYLEWKITGGQTSLGTVDVMRKLMTDALWRSREHTFNSITDARSKEARAWVPIALKLADSINKADPDKVNSLEELRIRLEGLDITTTRSKLEGVEILS